MIKKTRIQIASVLLALIFFFIAFAYGSALFDMVRAIENSAEEVLAIMHRSIDVRLDASGQPQIFVNPILEEFRKEDLEEEYNRITGFCALAYDDGGVTKVSYIQKGEAYTAADIEDVVKSVLTTEDPQGRYQGYYFVLDRQPGSNVISVVDKNSEWDSLRRTAFSMLFINLSGFLVTAAIVWVLTGFITRPIADAMETKKRFISDASHELKTPLTIISANTEVLKEELGSNNGWLNNIDAQTHRMQNLVQEMLQLSSVEEAGSVKKKERFSLTETAEESVLPFDAIAYERGLNLTYQFDPGLYAVGDPDAFRKIVGTLLDNAIKYCQDKGTVDVVLKQNQNTAIFSVYNTGCGIKNSERKRVFERFYRSDQSRARSTGGSGLGLSIAQATSKLNNWHLKLDSEEDQYTKFVLTLKLSQ